MPESPVLSLQEDCCGFSQGGEYSLFLEVKGQVTPGLRDSLKGDLGEAAQCVSAAPARV